MTKRNLAAPVAMLLSVLTGGLVAQANRVDLEPAWAAWGAGQIDLAQRLGNEAVAAGRALDEAHHLLCLTAFVTGDYRGSRDHYHAIGSTYRRLAELDDTVLESHIHLGELQEALDFAVKRPAVRPLTVRRLEAHARRPLSINLPDLTVVPFADHPLTDYLPAFNAEINGQALTVHLDTGGTYLMMGPARAASLGITTVKGGKGEAHLNRTRVDMSHGIADRLALGQAVLQNVPVDVVSTLTGDVDLVILGTNLLEPFLATLDYPSRRMLLSKRRDPTTRVAHVAMLPAASVVVPFYLWSDHFMFARGSLGDRVHLNFFVDSGLVSLHPDGTGGSRQASFTSSEKKFRRWGIARSDLRRGVFESAAALCLGPLCQQRPLCVVGAAGDTTFGGIRIDGLISHAFLKRYVWTIDFDARIYQFAEPSFRID